MKHIDCVIQQVRLCDRRNFDRTAPVIAKAQLNPLDLKQIDDAAFLLDCTRTEFILSAATSIAAAYLDQRKGDQVRTRRQST